MNLYSQLEIGWSVHCALWTNLHNAASKVDSFCSSFDMVWQQYEGTKEVTDSILRLTSFLTSVKMEYFWAEDVKIVHAYNTSSTQTYSIYYLIMKIAI